MHAEKDVSRSSFQPSIMKTNYKYPYAKAQAPTKQSPRMLRSRAFESRNDNRKIKRLLRNPE